MVVGKHEVARVSLSTRQESFLGEGTVVSNFLNVSGRWT